MGEVPNGSGGFFEQAFIGSVTGSVAVPIPPGFSGTQAFGINDSGQVTGLASGKTGQQPFIGTTAASAVVALPPGMTTCQGQSINGSGQIAGYRGTQAQALVGSMGGSSTVPIPPGFSGSAAYGINASGQIAGEASVPGNFQPAIGTAAGMSTIPLPPGFSSGAAMAINDLGQVAGWGFGPTGEQQAFVGTAAGTTAIPLAPSSDYATAVEGSINSAGTVVGTSIAGGWIWDPANGTQLLNTFVPSGWNVSQAISINDGGQILAIGSLDGAPTEYVLLTPEQSTPEPATGACVAGALLLTIAFGRRRKEEKYGRG